MRKLCIYYHSNNWKKPCNNMIAKNLHTAKEKFPEGFFGSSILYINKWNVNKWFFSNEIELFMAYEIDCATMLELYRNSGSWTITQVVLMSLYLIIILKHPLIIYGFSFSASNFGQSGRPAAFGFLPEKTEKRRNGNGGTGGRTGDCGPAGGVASAALASCQVTPTGIA